MTENNESLKILFEKVFNDIQIHNIDSFQPNEEMFYIAYLEDGIPFSLSEQGFDICFNSIVSELLSISQVNACWSREDLSDPIKSTINALAHNKLTNNISPEHFINDEVEKLIAYVMKDFYPKVYFIPINGLTTKEILFFGDVAIQPLENFFQENTIPEILNNFSRLRPERYSIASSEICAANQKAGRILKKRVERVLNILKFYSSIIYWDRPLPYIFIDGQSFERFSKMLIKDKYENFSTDYMISFPPYPINLNEISTFGAKYGFNYLLQMLNKNCLWPIESLLLNSIDWYGDAIQDTNCLSSFMKYYIAVESLVKEDEKKAGDVLPIRIPWILEKYSPEKHKELNRMVKEIILERNSIFHSGVTINQTPENLSVNMRLLTRNFIYRFIHLLERENWQTKTDFINWVSDRMKENIDLHKRRKDRS